MGLALATLVACRSAPRAARPQAPAQVPDATPAEVGPPRPWDPAPQPGSVIANVDGTAVLALAAPQFAKLSREQRLLAWRVAQALAAGDALAWEQGYRHNLEVVRVLRAILSRSQVVPAALLPRMRAYARVLYLNHGMHDPDTGRKEVATFTASDLRAAALAARAAGADLGLRGATLEYALRALEGPLLDPRLDARRTAHGLDKDPLLSSAVNLYAGVSLRDLRGFRERFPLGSRLAKQDGVLVEQVYRLPAVAAGLDEALPLAAPPQRAVLEGLSAFFRSGDPALLHSAERAWLEAAGPVDFFAGFLDLSADPRGRKGLYGGLVGIADPERNPPLRAVAQAAAALEEKLPGAQGARRPGPRPAAAEALLLAAASGALRPLRFPALTLPLEAPDRRQAGVKTALFSAADDAVAQVRSSGVVAALAEPALAAELVRCLPQQRFAFLALREIAGRSWGPAQDDARERLGTGAGVLEEARADLAAHFLAADPLVRELGLLPDLRCQQLWPQFAATGWLAAAGQVSFGDRVEDDRGRAVQLQIWWFTGKGGFVERNAGGRRYLAVPDPARFRGAAEGLLGLLQQIESLGDGGRLTDLLERHASRLDAQWRDDVLDRLRTANLPRRVAVLPPLLQPILQDGKVVDAEAIPIDDLDAQILRDWTNF
jgi:dipeptidyl-peptidase-3